MNKTTLSKTTPKLRPIKRTLSKSSTTMANQNIQLKIKHSKGQFVVSDLTFENTLLDLKKTIGQLTGSEHSSIKVLRGYPPLPLLFEDKNTLGECGIERRDMLVTEISQASNKDEKKEVDPSGPASKVSPPSAIPSQANGSQNGFLMRKTVPSDNSCFFTSIGFCLTGKVDPLQANYLRQLAMSTIQSSPEIYSAAFLGRPSLEYCQWIMRDDSWGGAIECSVLSSYYGMEIDVVDTQHGIISRFGEDMEYGQRILLIYDGIHYDALYLEAVTGGVLQTIFPTEEDFILKQAEDIAAEARASHQYTDVTGFSLRCLDCSKLLTGQKEAQSHAKTSGHTNFGEVESIS